LEAGSGKQKSYQMNGTVRPVLRFAPSPNGPLHLGHAFSVLTGLDWARRLGGRFLVRIEDIDPERSSEAHIAGIFRDLAWLGVPWEEPVLRQSQHIERYVVAAARLADLGLLYPCFASRREIVEASAVQGASRDPDGAPLYPGLHRKLTREEIAARRERGEPFVMRLDIARALVLARDRLHGAPLEFIELDESGAVQHLPCDPARWGDVVIQRKDVPTSYHLSVVVDDACQGITHVTRGRDLFAATDIHRLLQVLLGLPAPVYAHHRLIMDESGRKLAKSARDTSLAEIRAAGGTLADVRRMIGLA
jgi:glutamyl-Q tRNA(Asp) synthetase